MKEGPQYTSCVARADFTKKGEMMAWAALDALLGAGIASGLMAIFTGGVIVPFAILAAVVAALKTVVDWLVNGKLVCLYRDASHSCNCGEHGNQVCAVGQIVDTEDVGQDKNPIEDLDNDYAMNLLLAPLTYRAFWEEHEKPLKDAQGNPLSDYDKFYALATAATQPQGDLITRQFSDLDWQAYHRTVVYNPQYDKHKAWTEIVGRDYGWGFGDDKQAYIDFLVKMGWGNDTAKFDVPVLHCEFEGSRQKDVLDALNTFTLGGSWCKKNFLFAAICKVVAAILAPLALAAAAYAWAAASDGDPADAIEGGGSIGADDWVVARGRWTYDGGHEGWNEMHATRTVQKVDAQYVPSNPAQFKAYMQKWCDLMGEIPRESATGEQSQPLTPEQKTVDDNQRNPANWWDAHPDIDGCTPDRHPEHEPDQPPIIR